MGDDHQELRQFIVGRMRKLAALMANPVLSNKELSLLSREMDLLARRLIGRWEPTDEDQEVIAFVERLETREGTITPDFQGLYEKKAELDRKLFDRNGHDPRP